jgi:NADH dehydrogenase
VTRGAPRANAQTWKNTGYNHKKYREESMSKQNICILGGSGFVGRSIARQLVAAGHKVTVITRHRERKRELLVLPNLKLIEGDAQDLGVLRTRFQGIDTVINLIGILNERGHKGKGFEHAHVDLAAKVVSACKQARVSRLLHMSALNASAQGPSHYMRTKGQAENIVHESETADFRVTSFRPSVIFGPHDSFLNRFAELLQRIPFAFPLACPRSRFQPVYVEDVARAFALALDDQHTYGQRYNLCGPKVYSLHELVEYVAQVIGVKRRIIDLQDWQSRLQANLMEWVPGKPFSQDNYNSMKNDSVCDAGFPAIFGFSPTPLEEVAPTYLGGRSDPYTAYRRLARRT